MQRKRILLMAEAVTLAHVTRPLVLANSLDPSLFDVHFACAAGYENILSNASFRYWRIDSLSSELFLRRLAAGACLYTYAMLQQYVEADLELLEAVQPDVVIGDFRLSLAVSARQARVPYLAITNAYWSPYAVDSPPLPEHPLARLTGIPVAEWFFQRLYPWIFAYHARPMNRLRKRHGLSSDRTLQQAYTEGDQTLYADIPALVPTTKLPDNHHYIGPVLWSPELDLPSWWNSIGNRRPTAYVTLGSSGNVALLPTVISALEAAGINGLVATAGRARLTKLPKNIWAGDYLPGIEAAKRADLVICNGGSPTTYQALYNGTPVVGIASNLDQYLNMTYVEKAGAGKLIRAGKTNQHELSTAFTAVMADKCRARAEGLARECQHYRSDECLKRLLAGTIR